MNPVDRKEWPQNSNHYIDIRKREEYENPTLSYYGVVDDYKPDENGIPY